MLKHERPRGSFFDAADLVAALVEATLRHVAEAEPPFLPALTVGTRGPELERAWCLHFDTVGAARSESVRAPKSGSLLQLGRTLLASKAHPSSHTVHRLNPNKMWTKPELLFRIDGDPGAAHHWINGLSESRSGEETTPGP